jgi:hypothetical protein
MELTWLAANHHELLLQESPEKLIRPDSKNRMHNLYKMEIGKNQLQPEMDRVFGRKR